MTKIFFGIFLRRFILIWKGEDLSFFKFVQNVFA